VEQHLPENRSHPLVGSAFHTVDPRGRTVWQGEIIADCGQGYFLVQLFDWFVGAETTRHVLTLEEIASKHPDGKLKFRLFESMDAANSYMEVWAKSRDESIDRAEQQKAETEEAGRGVLYDSFGERPAPPPEYDPDNWGESVFFWENHSAAEPLDEINSVNDLPPKVHANVVKANIQADRRGAISILGWRREFIPADKLTLPPECKIDGLWQYRVKTRAAWR
jgi:hypothetical protein